MSQPIFAPMLTDIQLMRARVAPFIRRTPIISLPGRNARHELLIKAECLQVAGSFKSRPAAALLAELSSADRAVGVNTASSGNFGIALSELGQRLGAPVTICVDPSASDYKVQAARRLGARLRDVSSDEWWSIVETNQFGGMSGAYLNAVSDPIALAANGTIGLEILEEIPDVDAICMPFGGGGLLCGVAAAVKALQPDIRIIACEFVGAAPLAAARAAGEPTQIAPEPSFITGVGARSVLREMWPLIRQFADDCITVSLDQAIEAIHVALMDAHILVEGAGALAIAAVMSGRVEARRPVCIASGGNISPNDIAAILEGRTPA